MVAMQKLRYSVWEEHYLYVSEIELRPTNEDSKNWDRETEVGYLLFNQMAR